ncbi:MAG: CPXCG motif-containing cysteine-rich protein [Bradymonadaceae bacterium]
MEDFVSLQCPYCFETFEIFIEFDVGGDLIQDCEICCRPLLLHVRRDRSGRLHVRVERAQ